MSDARTATESRTECFACRVTGTATFTGLGIYALWMSRAAAPGSPGSKKFVAAFGAAMLVGGVLRWKQTGDSTPSTSSDT
ncbi:hypothetical protein FB451DRAFT_1385523 [Mycena latifolia]|nr:hypothetical protein FB451DRAFT_1385523 [Mycena latifolia]